MSHGKGNHKSIRQALEYVAKNPEWPDISRLEMPVWEMVARNLYDMATSADKSRGAQNRRTRAQKIILNRYTGTRRTGTAPAVRNAKEVILHDLTAGHEDEQPVEDPTRVEVTL
jgi:hypothetical protein